MLGVLHTQVLYGDDDDVLCFYGTVADGIVVSIARFTSAAAGRRRGRPRRARSAGLLARRGPYQRGLRYILRGHVGKKTWQRGHVAQFGGDAWKCGFRSFSLFFVVYYWVFIVFFGFS